MLNKHLPIVLFYTYLIVGYLLFENGPWPWPVMDYRPIRIYFVSSLLVILLGYRLAFRLPLSQKNGYYFESISFLKLVIVLAFLDVMFVSVARSGSIFPDVVYGLTNPGEAYSQYVYKSFNRGYWTLLEYANVLLYFSFLTASVGVFYYWSKLSFFYKFLGVVSVIYFVLIHVAIGVSKGVVMVLLPLPVTLVFLRVAAGKMNIRRFIGQSAVILMLFLTFVTFFTHIQREREGGVSKNGEFGPPISIVADRDSSLPLGLSIAVESLTRYLNQGYYVLSEGLVAEGYVSGRGVGASMFLMRKSGVLFGDDWLNNTLMFKLEQDLGWGVYELWHSMPLWLINGFGITGSLICLFFFGYAYGRCWKSLRNRVTILRGVLFLVLNTMFMYYSANNQIFQNAEGIISLLIILILMVLSKWRITFFPRRERTRVDNSKIETASGKR